MFGEESIFWMLTRSPEVTAAYRKAFLGAGHFIMKVVRKPGVFNHASDNIENSPSRLDQLGQPATEATVLFRNEDDPGWPEFAANYKPQH